MDNVIMIDWLSFTIKDCSVWEVSRMIGCGNLKWQLIKGARGYKHRLYYEGISLHYEGTDEMGVWCEMSGAGCRAFESFSSLSWVELIDLLFTMNHVNITRTDIAYDDHQGILPMDQIVSDTLCGMWISKSRFWESVQSSKGSSIYFGSPQSQIRIRIYDKAAERGFIDRHWVRVELQLRDERAKSFLSLNKSFGDSFTGVVRNYLRFIYPNKDTNKQRWPMQPYWEQLLNDASAIQLYQDLGMEYNLGNLEHYVFDMAGGAIDTAVQIFGEDEFLRRIKERPQNYDRNLKYAALLDLYSNS